MMSETTTQVIRALVDSSKACCTGSVDPRAIAPEYEDHVLGVLHLTMPFQSQMTIKKAESA